LLPLQLPADGRMPMTGNGELQAIVVAWPELPVWLNDCGWSARFDDVIEYCTVFDV